jgi:hypothetical protein
MAVHCWVNRSAQGWLARRRHGSAALGDLAHQLKCDWSGELTEHSRTYTNVHDKYASIKFV